MSRVVLFCGSREKSFFDEDERNTASAKIMFRMQRLKECYGDELVILTGGASGVDSMALEFARLMNIRTHVMRPDWETHGKKAPIIRDEEMVMRAHHVIALWNGKSPGTGHTLSFARKHRVSHEVYFFNGRTSTRTKISR